MRSAKQPATPVARSCPNRTQGAPRSNAPHYNSHPASMAPNHSRSAPQRLNGNIGSRVAILPRPPALLAYPRYSPSLLQQGTGRAGYRTTGRQEASHDPGPSMRR